MTIQHHTQGWNYFQRNGQQYRWRGEFLSGWPKNVAFFNEQLQEWWPCPNVNVHTAIARHIEANGSSELAR